MICGACGANQLSHDVRDFPYLYKGKKIVIASLEADYCAACGEVILDAHGASRLSALIREFQQRVDNGEKKSLDM
ncbi:type II toxin-antitoxin system MqsA family antitoxin [Duganella radicis]|uniref:YgiT-type zinc finger protein n=1 Tax=Duganella radicis TaxID=551988 RepID=A0A6L6PKL4_9BURK|nr:YgiT-type zinc finger protein [Duganella radicis]